MNTRHNDLLRRVQPQEDQDPFIELTDSLPRLIMLARESRDTAAEQILLRFHFDLQHLCYRRGINLRPVQVNEVR